MKEFSYGIVTQFLILCQKNHMCFIIKSYFSLSINQKLNTFFNFAKCRELEITTLQNVCYLLIRIMYFTTMKSMSPCLAPRKFPHPEYSVSFRRSMSLTAKVGKEKQNDGKHILCQTILRRDT